MSVRRVLVVDDEPGMLEVCGDTLRRLPDLEIVLEGSASRAAERLRDEHFDLVVADVRMPEMSGIDLLRVARERQPDVAALVITAYPTVEGAVESMKLGAADYMMKPIRPDELRAAAGRLLECQGLRRENELLTRRFDRGRAFDDIIGDSPAMRAVYDTIERVAGTDVDVLIQGETGSGKELVARSIHRRSRRASGKFVPVDCSAIPEDLLESEFFGHERGAFTGAHAQALGLLEFAHRGTFFLDEIGELPLPLQAKLLRALQERSIRRVGGKEEVPVDVRVLAATARDLGQEVRERRFRPDLYYRVNVVGIQVPPLRERIEDIPLLADHFVARYAREMDRGELRVDPDAMEVLKRYGWPGNVRELQNVVKRSIAMTRAKVVTPSDLPDELVLQAGTTTPTPERGFFAERGRTVARFEREYLGRLMEEHGGDAVAAAEAGGLPLGTLYRLLKKNGLRAEDFRSAG